MLWGPQGPHARPIREPTAGWVAASCFSDPARTTGELRKRTGKGEWYTTDRSPLGREVAKTCPPGAFFAPCV